MKAMQDAVDQAQEQLLRQLVRLDALQISSGAHTTRARRRLCAANLNKMLDDLDCAATDTSSSLTTQLSSSGLPQPQPPEDKPPVSPPPSPSPSPVAKKSRGGGRPTGASDAAPRSRRTRDEISRAQARAAAEAYRAAAPLRTWMATGAAQASVAAAAASPATSAAGAPTAAAAAAAAAANAAFAAAATASAAANLTPNSAAQQAAMPACSTSAAVEANAQTHNIRILHGQAHRGVDEDDDDAAAAAGGGGFSACPAFTVADEDDGDGGEYASSDDEEEDGRDGGNQSANHGDSVYSFAGARLAEFLVSQAKTAMNGLSRVGRGGQARVACAFGCGSCGGILSGGGAEVSGSAGGGGRTLVGRLNSLWVEPPDPCLKKGALEPFDFMLQLYGRLFLWIPELYFKADFPHGVPPCKWHGKCDCVNVKDALNPNGPRLVFALDHVYWLWAPRYICTQNKAEGKKYQFSGSDPDVVVQLPAHVRNQFPAVLTHRKAIDAAAVRQLERCIMSGGSGFSGFRKDILEEHTERWRALHESYVSAVNTRRRQLFANDQNATLTNTPFLQPRTPRDIYTRDGAQRGRFPSEAWLRNVWIAYAESRKAFHDRHMQVCAQAFVGFPPHLHCHIRTQYAHAHSTHTHNTLHAHNMHTTQYAHTQHAHRQYSHDMRIPDRARTAQFASL